MIQIRTLETCLGNFHLGPLDLEVESGQYFVLMGPPGAGKTILLECLCGLKRIRAGQILLDGQDVTHWEPRLRPIAYVPQDYALFPHLSVQDNIAFGLRAQRIPRDTRIRRVTEIADMLGIESLLTRGIVGLSGGEKQRTALARALVQQPRVLLLDEPVCALDEATRRDVCTGLLRIQRQLNLTTIHVSHNLEEAFSVGDCAAILHHGRLEQGGPLTHLLRAPDNAFVAHFMRCENILTGQAVSADTGTHHTSLISIGDQRLRVQGHHEGQVQLMIRPDQIQVKPNSEQNSTENGNTFPVRLTEWRDFGGYIKATLQGPLTLVVHINPSTFKHLQQQHPDQLVVHLDPNLIHVISP
jgi:molybdate/tungstate transport system ATP-binding protein